jgi:hypothetical protein
MAKTIIFQTQGRFQLKCVWLWVYKFYKKARFWLPKRLSPYLYVYHGAGKRDREFYSFHTRSIWTS